MGLGERYKALTATLDLLWDVQPRPTLGRAFPAGNAHYAAAGRAAIEASKEVAAARRSITATHASARDKAISQLQTDLADLDAQMGQRREQLRRRRPTNLTVACSTDTDMAGGRRLQPQPPPPLSPPPHQQGQPTEVAEADPGHALAANAQRKVRGAAHAADALVGGLLQSRVTREHKIELVSAEEMPWRTSLDGRVPPSCYALVYWNGMCLGQTDVVERERAPRWRRSFVPSMRHSGANELLVQVFAMPTDAPPEVVRRPWRPCWRPFWLRFTYVTSVLVKKS
eukprot:COSAG01_NODE_989_length_12296_cov_244.291629_12_plen_284_part_00